MVMEKRTKLMLILITGTYITLGLLVWVTFNMQFIVEEYLISVDCIPNPIFNGTGNFSLPSLVSP